MTLYLNIMSILRVRIVSALFFFSLISSFCAVGRIFLKQNFQPQIAHPAKKVETRHNKPAFEFVRKL